MTFNAEEIVPVVSIVLTCFNRRDTTLKCLKKLHAQSGEGELFHSKVFLLDDSSTDGTEEAVREAYPKVNLLKGSGTLFWGGGMHQAMGAALKERHDFILLLNDDVDLRHDALQYSLSVYRNVIDGCDRDDQIIVGAVVQPGTDIITYSGFDRSSLIDPSKLKRVAPDPIKPRRCDTMNGNFVLIPSEVSRKLGPIDGRFIHQLGDLDYGYRLCRAGGGVWIASEPLGACSANTRKMSFEMPGLSLNEKWRRINSPLGLPVSSWTRFMWRHGGGLSILILIAIYLKKILSKQGNHKYDITQ